MTSALLTMTTSFLAEVDPTTIALLVGLLIVFVLLVIFLKFFKLWIKAPFEQFGQADLFGAHAVKRG